MIGPEATVAPRLGKLIGAGQNCHGCIEMLSSKTFRASWSIGLAAGLLAAVPPGRIARAENIVADGAVAAHLLDAAASEGAFRHLRALQDVAPVSGGNRAAGTPGYDRSAEYGIRARLCSADPSRDLHIRQVLAPVRPVAGRGL